MIRDFIILLKRLAIVAVMLALLSPLVAHQLIGQFFHSLVVLVFGSGGAHAPSIRISP